uniref:Resolvase n=1 Tax=Globodera pallida TaxID=36090 RepID=A0A183BPJ1_GLOPA
MINGSIATVTPRGNVWSPMRKRRQHGKGGYVYMDVPHKERTFDQALPRTPLAELLDRHAGKRLPTAENLKPKGHKSVWITEDLLELCKNFNWNVVKWRNVDDKVGNGFTIVIKK